MIDSRCLTCRHWQPPPFGARAGHCALDDQLTHAGYSCARFVLRPAALLASLGISTDELAWLRGHPDDRVTDALRLSFARVQITKGEEAEVDRFMRQLREWRDRRDTCAFEDYICRLTPRRVRRG